MPSTPRRSRPSAPHPHHPSPDAEALKHLLAQVASGVVAPEQAFNKLQMLAVEDLGFAALDHHRTLRKGFPEVIYCAGKTTAQVAKIAERLAAAGAAGGGNILGTRASVEQYRAARRKIPGLRYDELARVMWLERRSDKPKHTGVAIVAAGTSDLPVAYEAVWTLRMMGHEPQCVFDVGVAGLHRLLPHVAGLRNANVVIAVAGMEGALPSVLGGLLPAPLIAVPTSVGYGASFHGLAALLAMLNSCAAGIAVVNIDNGFGAGYMAARINQGVVDAVASKAANSGRDARATPPVTRASRSQKVIL